MKEIIEKLERDIIDCGFVVFSIDEAKILLKQIKGQQLKEMQLCDGCNVREPWEHRCHGKNCNCKEPVCMERQSKITYEKLMEIVNKEQSIKDEK